MSEESVAGDAALDKVMAALHARGCHPKPVGPAKWRARCPAHTDKEPSLFITNVPGKVLLYCHSCKGTTRASVLPVLGLEARDLFDRPVPALSGGPQRRVAKYEYCDLRGVAYARKLRFGPRKRFCWQRPTGTGRWVKGLDGIKPGLFGIEQAIDATQVFITEGEKAALKLREQGFVAVAPPNGAGCWQEEWSEMLWRVGGQDIVVLPDADRPGRTGASKVAASIHRWRLVLPLADGPDANVPDLGVALEPGEVAPMSVKVLMLPGLGHAEDVFDWFERYGHTAGELRALAAATPTWMPVDRAQRKRERDAERQRRRYWATRQPRPAFYERVCLGCGHGFTARSATARTCSAACRQRVRRQSVSHLTSHIPALSVTGRGPSRETSSFFCKEHLTEREGEV
ncbi:MAG: hypothetical protein ACRD3C_23910 [Vicinamibacterales bacterium]